MLPMAPDTNPCIQTMRERDFHRWEPNPFGGRMRNGLLRVGFALSDDLTEQDGGFCCT
jgi:hypothetical protein